jgi:hypothetical protein
VIPQSLLFSTIDVEPTPQVPAHVLGMPVTSGFRRSIHQSRAIAESDLSPARLLPISIPTAPALPRLSGNRSSLLQALVKTDLAGRIYAESLFQALDWQKGDRVDIQEDGSRLVATKSANGSLELLSRGRLRVPDPMRKFRSWTPGAQLWLWADLTSHTLTIADPGELITQMEQPLDKRYIC